jgi:hypothetical protein
MRQMLVALVAATIFLVWMGFNLADGSIAVRSSIHAFPSFMFIFDVVLVGLIAMIVAVAWVRTIGKAGSRRKE